MICSPKYPAHSRHCQRGGAGVIALLIFLIVTIIAVAGYTAYRWLQPRPSGILPVISPVPSPSKNLAVTVRYQANQGFQLTIEDVVLTDEDPTIVHYAPPAGSSYSVIELLDAGGQTIAEERFTVATGYIREEFGESGVETSGEQELSESTAYLVLPVGSDHEVAMVRLKTATGQVLDEQRVL
jgi:hypothetical protein